MVAKFSNSAQWLSIRNRILVFGESIAYVARTERMSRNTVRRTLTAKAPPVDASSRSPMTKLVFSARVMKLRNADVERQKWMELLYELEHSTSPKDKLEAALAGQPRHLHKRILSVIAHRSGLSIDTVASHICLSPKTVRRYCELYESRGLDALLGRQPRLHKADDEAFKKMLFGLLHEPPSLSGFNRTTWRMTDLQETLATKGFPTCRSVIDEAIKKAGYRWKSAKVVLTSTDPDYREKLDRVQTVLSHLRADECFFSIDEYGPFAVRAKPGRVRVAPGVNPSVPQWQKSKGWLIATTALELSHNQVTHFYSTAKNTGEMIKMADILLAEYRDKKTLYLSWDAASWHMSKELLKFVDKHNATAKAKGYPKLELVPLPASAQFLNVIESVFSGMARAIIHNSDYPSVEAACNAIDQYFKERNQHYAKHPKRAGNKIWGEERTAAMFDPANNCKDPAYR